MIKQRKTIQIILCSALVALFTAACGPPKTVTQSMSEAEFKQEAFLCRNNGLDADLQPGKIVCTGDLDGQSLVVNIVAEIVDGNIIFQIVDATADGKVLAPEEYADLNAEMAADIYYPEENYAITSVVITDSDLTITMQLK